MPLLVYAFETWTSNKADFNLFHDVIRHQTSTYMNCELALENVLIVLDTGLPRIGEEAQATCPFWTGSPQESAGPVSVLLRFAMASNVPPGWQSPRRRPSICLLNGQTRKVG